MNMTEKAPGDVQAAIDKLGLKVSSKFIPFSQSRHAKAKQPDLNWEVTLYTETTVTGARRDILTTLYSAGSAHCPSYKHPDAPERDYRVAYECERGFKAVGVRWGSKPEAYGAEGNKANAIEPKALDVIYSLVMDTDVLDAGGFESWASDLGYDTDSRTAEKIYHTCLELALKLRSAIGEAGLVALREAFQDY